MANENMKNPFRLLLNMLHRLLDDKADAEYVDQKIDEISKDVSLGISEAVVGQIAKIMGVDENGRPVKWETVELPDGVSSWNDLTDKPFYTEYTTEVIVEEQSFAAPEDNYSFDKCFDELFDYHEPTIGVMWDGVMHVCDYNDNSVMYGYNFSLDGEFSCSAWEGSGTLYIDKSGEHTLSLHKIISKTTKKIPAEYVDTPNVKLVTIDVQYPVDGVGISATVSESVVDLYRLINSNVDTAAAVTPYFRVHIGSEKYCGYGTVSTCSTYHNIIFCIPAPIKVSDYYIPDITKLLQVTIIDDGDLGTVTASVVDVQSATEITE